MGTVPDLGRRDPRPRAGIPPTFWGSHLPHPPSPGKTGFLGLWAQQDLRTPGSITTAAPAQASSAGTHAWGPDSPTLPGIRWGSRVGHSPGPGGSAVLPEPEGSTRRIWPAVAPGTCSVLLLALKHSKITFASHFQKIATVKTEGSQLRGGDPATQPAPPEAMGVGGRGCTLHLPGPQETTSPAP